MIPVIGEICDVASGIISVAKGDWGGAVLSLASVIPVIGSASGAAKLAKNAVKLVNKADDIIDTGKIIINAERGYDSFKALQKAIGSPGERKVWHHIVEQCQGVGRTGFDTRIINNPNNVISIDKATNELINGYYSSIQKFTGGMTVRDWLTGMSFEEQYEFGLQVLRDFGIIP